jgi:Leucine Rich Repeat (LRR) protein
MEASSAGSGPERQQEISRRRAWIRGALGTTAVIASCLGWWVYTARLQREAVATIRALGGTVIYADDMPFEDPSAPVLWLERKLGHDYTSPIGMVNLGGRGVGNEDLGFLAQLRGLRALRLDGADIDDEALQMVGQLRRLEELSLSGTQITDAGLAHLSKLERLEFLYLYDTQITNAGLVHFDRLASLKCLELRRTRVTAMGARKLSQALPDLRITY